VRLADEDFCLNGPTAHLAFFKAKFEDRDPICLEDNGVSATTGKTG
jgi:hypothetical protein